MIRVILFEDKQSVRKSIERLFKNNKTIYFAEAFTDANDAVREVQRCEPDVVLMDIQMPDTSGLDALATVRSAFPTVKVVMLTSFQDNDKIFTAICNGAAGYVLKDDIEGIEQIIHEVAESGAAHISPNIANRVMQLLQSTQVRVQPSYVALTPKEQEVLGEMVNGKSRKELATHFKISFDAIGDHLKNIYKKLEVNSAPAAVREAILRKIV